MGDGTKENPFTREDVLRLIEENGGTAKGLDLSGKVFEEGIDLSGLELKGIILEGAKLEEANLEKTKLAGANLQRVNLSFANLQGVRCGGIDLRKAMLFGTNFRGAVLSGANMEGAFYASMEFSRDTQFINVNWGSKFATLQTEPKGILHGAFERTYRELKNWHSDTGMYDIAGQFFYWEMEAKRKCLGWWPNPLRKIRQTLYWLLSGYGEKPFRVVASATFVIFGLAAAYYFWGSFSSSSFWDTLYYSAASFTALGYGNWAPQPTGWAKGMGAAEAFMGVFMMALFLITFVRKMTR